MYSMQYLQAAYTARVDVCLRIHVHVHELPTTSYIFAARSMAGYLPDN